MRTRCKHCSAEELQLQTFSFLDRQFCTSPKFGKTDALLECRLPDGTEQLKVQIDAFVFTDVLQTLEVFPLQTLQKEDNSPPFALTSKLNIHKDFDKRLGEMGSVLVGAEHSLAVKHTRDERVLGLI